MYLVASFLALLNTELSIFYLFYIAQKLPHQGSGRAIKNKLYHHHHHQLTAGEDEANFRSGHVIWECFGYLALVSFSGFT